MTLIRLKAKYRSRIKVRKNVYRPRTGPQCCNEGCGRRGRKPGHVKWGKLTGLGK